MTVYAEITAIWCIVKSGRRQFLQLPYTLSASLILTALFLGGCLPLPSLSGHEAAGSGALEVADKENHSVESTRTGSEEGLFLNGVFPIGVFSQPQDSFEKWKSRGINTLLETPQGHDPSAWDKAAKSSGLYVIRRPLANPRDDIGRKDLLAWSHWDEPDAAGRIAEWTPLFERTAEEWRRIDPNRRIFINFAGPDLSWFAVRTDAYSKNHASFYPRLIATADWIANDLYPSGGWLNQAHAPRRGDITLLGEPIKILKGMTDKPQFAFIEASEIERGNVPGARCPTRDEFRAQIWYAITQGVRGLFYFPAVVGKSGFRFDGAPPEIVAEMTKQNALIKRAAPLLQSEINPASMGVEAPAGVSVTWRRGKNSGLFILVNATRQTIPNARFIFKGIEAAGSAESLSDGRILKLQKGVLSESLEPLGVRILLAPIR